MTSDRISSREFLEDRSGDVQHSLLPREHRNSGGSFFLVGKCGLWLGNKALKKHARDLSGISLIGNSSLAFRRKMSCSNKVVSKDCFQNYSSKIVYRTAGDNCKKLPVPFGFID